MDSYFILVVFLQSIICIHGCDIIGLNLCTWKLSQNISGSQDFTVLPNSDQIQNLCAHREEFTSCYQPKLSKCSDTLVYVSTFATTLKTIDFICTAGFLEMVEHDSCWRIPGVQNKSNSCYKEHVEKVIGLLEMSSSVNDPFSEESKQSWCRTLKSADECMMDSVRGICKQTSINVVSDMMSTVFDQMNSVMDCRQQDTISLDRWQTEWEPVTPNRGCDLGPRWEMVSMVMITTAIKTYQI